MKRIFLNSICGRAIAVIFLAMVLSTMVNAQSDKDEVEYIQAVIGMQKKVAFAEFTQLDNNDPLWELYDMYEIQRMELGRTRLDLLEKYANNYVDIGDVVTDDLIKRMQIQKKSLDKLIDQYYKKIKKASGSKVAAQFYQFENYILSAIRLEVLESIPFIGELE